MALDAKYIIAPSLEQYFVDKDTGLPLSNGKVYFYINNTNTPKPAYTYSDPNYVALDNPSILSTVGTFQDALGNNILPFYYPYDANGNVELYTIEVYSEDDVLQFTRDNFPPFTSQGVAGEDLINYIPNGQFLAHNTTFPTSSKITQASSNVAQGGWTVETNDPPTGTYYVTYDEYLGVIPALDDYPRNALVLERVTAGTDNLLTLRVKWPNANKFASPDLNNPQPYTIFCALKTQSGTANVDVNLYKYYGSGGTPSSPTRTNITTFNVTNSYQYFKYAFNFGNNDLKTFGTDGNDFVALEFTVQGNGSFKLYHTDFALLFGDVVDDVGTFPTTTDAQMLAEGVAGWMPTPAADGSDLYLPLVLTAQGLTFDSSQVGKIYASVLPTAQIGELICDGSAYVASSYSNDGIPYSRLFNKLYNNGNSLNVPIFGTGANFVTAYVNAGTTSQIRFCTNKTSAAQTPAANGVGTPLSAVAKVIDASTGFNFTAYTSGTALITGFCNTAGTTTAISAGTSGMTVAQVVNIAGSYATFTIIASTAAALGNGAGTGKYVDVSNTTTGYRYWFKTATETAPAAGGNTLVQVDLDITMTAEDVASAFANVLNGFQVYNLTANAAASINASDYFTFQANGTNYYVWYKKDNAGSDPAPGGTGIMATIATGYTANQVAVATQKAINSYQFAVPDLRGVFLRGQDTIGYWDIDYAARFSLVNTLPASSVGTLEYGIFGSHKHTNSTSTATHQADTTIASPRTTIGYGTGASPNTSTDVTVTINASGGTETRPVNMFVNYVIKY